MPKVPRPGSAAPDRVGALIALRRRVRGWSLQRLATRAGCSRSYLWMIESGQRSSPREHVLRRIESALGFAEGELVAAAQWEAIPGHLRQRVDEMRSAHRAAVRLAEILGPGQKQPLDRAHQSGELSRLVDQLRPDQPRAPRRHATASVPLINRVAAGYPREFTDLGYPAGIADDYLRIPGVTDEAAFACRVVGDSMLPEYREGDIVIFSPARRITSGSDCLARLEPDSETTFKRIFLERQGTRELIRLQPLNPSYPPRTLPREQISGLFAAISVTRLVGK